MVLVLTDESVRRLSTDRAQQDFFDAEFHGGSFMVRVSRGGAKSYVLAYRFRGRRRRLTLGRHPDLGLEEARGAARRALRDRDAGIDPGRGPVGTGTLRLFYARAFAPQHVEGDARLRDATRRHYRWAFERHILTSELADLPLDSVLESDVDGFARRLTDAGLSPATVSGILTCLAKCFAWAVRRGALERSPAVFPARRARRALKRPRSPRPLDRRQAEALLRAARDVCPDDGYLFILTALHTGLRPRELRSLRWEDVDLGGRTLTIGCGPGAAAAGRRRRVDLSDALVEALSAHRQTLEKSAARGPAPPVWVFHNRAGRRIDFRNFKKRRFRRVARRAGLAGLRFGDLRDTCAALLLSAGRPLEAVAAQLGDAHPGLTARRYAGWLKAAGRTALDALPAPPDTG